MTKISWPSCIVYGRPLRWIWCKSHWGEGAGPAPYGATLCPAMTALSTGSGRLPLSPFFLQGLLEERNNQVFFGEVGRQMVTGLMTKAEKVAGVGLLFQISLQNLISGWVFVLFCFEC